MSSGGEFDNVIRYVWQLQRHIVSDTLRLIDCYGLMVLPQILWFNMVQLQLECEISHIREYVYTLIFYKHISYHFSSLILCALHTSVLQWLSPSIIIPDRDFHCQIVTYAAEASFDH